MTNETTKQSRLTMTIVAVLIGLFLMFSAPFLGAKALSTPLHRLVEINQIQNPKSGIGI